ncbi:Uncharacterised protein [Streptococcus pneumoniae]|nr:Uncharacterised protein [Streptococcus pneumoniae]
MPIAFAKSKTSLKISSEVSSVRITSPVLRNQISLAKCNAKNFSGLPVTSLN